MTDKIDPNERIEAIWCKDKETSEKCLCDLVTGKVLIRLPIKTDKLEDNRPSKGDSDEVA